MPSSLELPTGTVRQRVPMTSAVRVGGERLYRKAHRGEVVETPPRDVEVYRAELLEQRRRDYARYEIECSAGTYIRTLVETLGDAYCASCAAPRSAPSGSRTPARRSRVERVGELVPAAAEAMR